MRLALVMLVAMTSVTSADGSRTGTSSVIRAKAIALQRCYDRLVKADADPGDRAVTVVVRFKIASSGKVTEATLRTATDPKFDACVKQTFLGLTFPRHSGGAEIINYPLAFHGDADPLPAPIERGSDEVLRAIHARARDDRGRVRALGACYVADGKWTYTVDIRADGAVSGVTSLSHPPEELDYCIIDALMRLRFSPATDASSITVPLMFRAE